jgi:hypothetical protein
MINYYFRHVYCILYDFKIHCPLNISFIDATHHAGKMGKLNAITFDSIGKTGTISGRDLSADRSLHYRTLEPINPRFSVTFQASRLLKAASVY